jgi:phage replication initiation protein
MSLESIVPWTIGAGTVPVATVREAVSAGQCVTRATQVRHIASNLTHGTGATTGETLYFGSPQSQTLLRIYDKRLEMQSKERENWQDYGVQVGTGAQERPGATVCPCLGYFR